MRLVILAVFFCSWVFAATDELSVSWIDAQTHAGKAYSIETLLGRFSRKSLERHLLAYHSESQQFASFLSPRVLVYNYDADFIMTYNGEPKSDGYHDLEILEFNHQKAAFEPHVFHFDPEGKKPPVFEAHPTVCATCHRTDIRPNWDPYFHWIGFYGSEDDSHPYSQEEKKYGEFLDKQKAEVVAKAGRYRFLPAHPSVRPNLDFNDRVTCLNLKRMLRLFASAPRSGQLWQFMTKQDPFTAADPFSDLPAELKKNARRTYREVFADTQEQIGRQINERLFRNQQITGEGPQSRAFALHPGEYDWSFHTVEHAQLAAFWRYAFEQVLGLSFRPVATSRHLDYDLNVDARENLEKLLAGATVAPDGRLVLSREKQTRPILGSFTCPRYGRYADLPVEK